MMVEDDARKISAGQGQSQSKTTILSKQNTSESYLGIGNKAIGIDYALLMKCKWIQFHARFT